MLLSFALLLGCFPVGALAAGTEPGEGAAHTIEEGGTYWFDLSGENIPGTVERSTTSYGIQPPDATLHWVPFTYTGMIDAYVLNGTLKQNTASTKAAATRDPDAPYGYCYEHSLFVSDYVVTHTVSWDTLDEEGLIFGRAYQAGNASYTLRSLSMGSSYSPQNQGTPASNEWDTIFDKNDSYIRYDGDRSWGAMKGVGQDTLYKANYAAWTRKARSNRRDGMGNYVVTSAASNNIGFRPALEVGSGEENALLAVAVDLNGGSIGGTAANAVTDPVSIVVKSGLSFAAPSSEGITAPLAEDEVPLSFLGWQASNGNVYAAGADVPAGVTSLKARWGYGLTLVLNGGTLRDAERYTSYLYGEGLTLPEPEKQGETFMGWYAEEDFSGEPVDKITADTAGDKTFYAKWLSANTAVTEVWVDGVAGHIEGNTITVVLPETTAQLPAGSKQVSIILANENASVKGLETTDGGATWTFHVLAEDGITEQTYHITVAIASKPTYLLTLRAEPVQGGTVQGGGMYEQGGSVTAEAVANAGYRFVEWQEDNVAVSTDAHYTFEIAADRELTAVFALEPPIPEVQTDSDDCAAWLGAGIVLTGGAALLAYYYRDALPIWPVNGFVRLEDGTSVPDATVTLLQDGEAVRTLTTDENGAYHTRVTKGVYQVTVSAEIDGTPLELTTEIEVQGKLLAEDIILTRPIN